MQSPTLARLSLVSAAVLVGAASCIGCAGLPKAELETRIAGLQKNAPLAALGVVRSSPTADVEYAYVRIPARAGASAPPLVFVHGTPSTLYNWSALLYESADEPSPVGDGEIYLLEVAGHGIARSDLRAETFQDCADHVRGFLDALDLRDVTLVGHSYGGEFAWRAALDAPERVARLVLMDSSGYRRADDAWLPEEHKLREWPGAGFGYLLNSRERLRPALQLHFGVPISDDQLEEMYLCCDNASNWRAMTELCRDENGTREAEIARLTQPTLLVWGEKDIAYPVETVARRFERDIRGARLAVIEGAGHYPHEERIGAVRRALREFLSGAR
jgi:pimeloyl-ACP methyl ester carboxylesterase